MSHHGEARYATGDRSPEEIRKDLERYQEDKVFMQQIEENYSDAMKALFQDFIRIYGEIKTMGIDPERLYRAWSINNIRRR